jgi:uncharacterized protein (DUF1501 family)
MSTWPLPSIGRRQFLGLGAGAVLAGLVGCDAESGRPASNAGSPAGGATSTGPATSLGTAPGGAFTGDLAGRRLVVVQMNGGNDLLNTLPPSVGRYRDLRPTLAVPEAEVVALAGVDDAGLHPALAGLTTFWDRGEMAILRGIGFDDPNRSHFVSMDRWWRADDLSAPGWLGRVVDGMPEQAPLFSTALGAGAPALNGATSAPTVVTSAASFRWAGIDAATISALGRGGGDDLAGRLRGAYGRAALAVDQFAGVTGTGADPEDLPDREGAATIAEGLGVAAQLFAADVGTRLVVVSAGGFDTHSGQTVAHSLLLSDVNNGIVAFFEAMEAAGLDEEVLLVTTSEFGRRAAENGSGGCDHGAGGLSLVIGKGVAGGMRGEVDLTDLLDGDVRPNVHPFGLYTACLDWIGADAEAVLGRRDDTLGLLRG